MKDSFGRVINYVRIAVTDRCNLRCFYCMPEHGNIWLNRSDLLSYEEILRLTNILGRLGVQKVKITGGEPFVRKDLMPFLSELTQIQGISNVGITTNGVFTEQHLDGLQKMGINSINLSLDTLDKARFHEITLRDEFDAVFSTYKALIDKDFKVKVNCVVMEQKNIADIIPMVELTRHSNVSIRFIEEMPFNGGKEHYEHLEWNHTKILKHIEDHFGAVTPLPFEPSSTSYNFKIAGFKGSFGIIAAYSRTFCGTCNRIRITPQGQLKTCLYDSGALDVRALLRDGSTDEIISIAIQQAVGKKAKDGIVAENTRHNHPVHESMATIGG